MKVSSDFAVLEQKGVEEPSIYSSVALRNMVRDLRSQQLTTENTVGFHSSLEGRETNITAEEWGQCQSEIAHLRKKYEDCKSQLDKYTNNVRHKRYYEENKDRVKENAKAYLHRLKAENPEKIKEYRHRAYIKRKAEKSLQESVATI